MMTIADQAAEKAFVSWDPGRAFLTHRQFALKTKLPGGPLKGSPCDPSTDPVQNYIVDQLDSGKWARVYWCASPQIAGKTQIAILVPALRAVVELRAVVGYGLPTLQDLDRGWTTKLSPTIKEAGFGAYLPITGPGSKGGRPPAVTFENPEDRSAMGSFVFLAGGAKQVTCRVVVVDEIDSWRDAGGTPRWSDLEDVWSRADSFQEAAIRIGTGTLETDNEDECIILVCVNALGTGTRLWAKCPHCGLHSPMEFDVNFSYEYRLTPDGSGPDLEHAVATARYACSKCAAIWSEDDRQAALRAAVFPHKGQTVDATGTIIGPPPQTKSFGIRTHALDCVLTTMGAIAEKECAARYTLEAHNNHEPMRKFYRYQRVEHYLKDRGQDGAPLVLTRGFLAARSAASNYSLDFGKDVRDEDGDTIHIAAKPEGIEFLTCTEDVQQGGRDGPGRNYFLLQGWSSNRTSWDLAWGTLTACPQGRFPTEGELHDCLERVHLLMNKTAADYGLPLLKRGVDVGDRLPEIRRWLIRHPEWLAIRGTDGNRTAKTGDIQGVIYCREQAGGWNLYEIDVNEMRQRAQNGFLAKPNTPGAAHIPEGIKANRALITHYCGTALISDSKGGYRWSSSKADANKHGEWQKRRDLLDCRTYGCALAEYQIRDLTKPKGPKRKYGVVGTAFGV